MTTFASIPERPTRITGFPHSGWRPADVNDPSSKVLPFRFDITDDGSGNFLLCYHSHDRVYCADSWHETLDQALDAAQETFGIARSEWQLPMPKITRANSR
jgi:hypothetical protein